MNPKLKALEDAIALFKAEEDQGDPYIYGALTLLSQLRDEQVRREKEERQEKRQAKRMRRVK